jgi:hypothetical protein
VRRDGGPLFWLSAGAGGVIIVFGVHSALAASHRTRPAVLARWIVGAAIVHDLGWIAVVGVASLATRWVPATLRPPLRWAVATSAILTLVAWPFVRGYGRNPGNPSLLPRSYAAGLLAYLAVIWALAAGWAVLAWAAAARRRR